MGDAEAADRRRHTVLTLSGYKSLERQAYLFDEPLPRHGHVRCVVGDLCERLTAAMVGGRRHKTDCTADYCPDVSDERGNYYESKAGGADPVLSECAGSSVGRRRTNAEGGQIVLPDFYFPPS